MGSTNWRGGGTAKNFAVVVIVVFPTFLARDKILPGEVKARLVEVKIDQVRTSETLKYVWYNF